MANVQTKEMGAEMGDTRELESHKGQEAEAAYEVMLKAEKEEGSLASIATTAFYLYSVGSYRPLSCTRICCMDQNTFNFITST